MRAQVDFNGRGPAPGTFSRQPDSHAVFRYLDAADEPVTVAEL